MELRKYISICLFILPICSCSFETTAEYNAELRSEAAENISTNMPLVTAVQHLALADFKCEDQDTSKIRCTRNQNHFMYACMQNIWLTTDSERKTIIGMDSGNACGGL